jgi:hypothetical protein
MSTLSKTYLYLDIALSASEAKELESYLLDVTQRFSSLLFRQSVQVRIDSWQGSFKALITVAGSIWIAVGAYGSIRSGLDYIINDGKVATRYIRETLIKDGLPEKQIIETTRQQCTPDRIRRLHRRIDSHKAKGIELKDNVRHEREAELIRNMAAKVVFEDLDNDHDIKMFLLSLDSEYKIQSLLDIEGENLPSAPSGQENGSRNFLSGGLMRMSTGEPDMSSSILEPRETFSLPKLPRFLDKPPYQ